MSEFIFNDIYGNQKMKQRYGQNKQYTYFVTILKLHNKYYENASIHENIFSARRTMLKAPAADDKSSYLSYKVEKVNNTTYRVRKPNSRSRSLRKETMDVGGEDKKGALVQPRDIKKDVKFLQTALGFQGSGMRGKQVHSRSISLGQTNKDTKNREKIDIIVKLKHLSNVRHNN